eukprot:6200670-Pleurochrysis_carterae.AAC.5
MLFTMRQQRKLRHAGPLSFVTAVALPSAPKLCIGRGFSLVPAEAFEFVTCALSIDYMRRPAELLAEVGAQPRALALAL